MPAVTYGFRPSAIRLGLSPPSQSVTERRMGSSSAIGPNRSVYLRRVEILNCFCIVEIFKRYIIFSHQLHTHSQQAVQQYSISFLQRIIIEPYTKHIRAYIFSSYRFADNFIIVVPRRRPAVRRLGEKLFCYKICGKISRLRGLRTNS